MTYVLSTDIELFYPKLTFSDGSSPDFLEKTFPSKTQVESLIALQEGYVDGRLGSLYSTPIAGTSDLKVVKLIVVKLVVGEIDKMFRESSANQASQYNYQKLNMKRDMTGEAEKMLQNILDGKISFAGGKSVVSYNSVDSNGDAVTPYFKRTTEF